MSPQLPHQRVQLKSIQLNGGAVFPYIIHNNVQGEKVCPVRSPESTSGIQGHPSMEARRSPAAASSGWAWPMTRSPLEAWQAASKACGSGECDIGRESWPEAACCTTWVKGALLCSQAVRPCKIEQVGKAFGGLELCIGS